MPKMMTHIRVPRHCGTRTIQTALEEVARIAWRNAGHQGKRLTHGDAVIEAIGLYIRTNGGQATLDDKDEFQQFRE